MRWLILFPYYFFGAMALMAFFMVLCRLLRIKTDINVVVGTAMSLAVGLLVAALAFGGVQLAMLKVVPLLVLGAASMLLAGVDAALARVLPLPLDKDLHTEK